MDKFVCIFAILMKIQRNNHKTTQFRHKNEEKYTNSFNPRKQFIPHQNSHNLKTHFSIHNKRFYHKFVENSTISPNIFDTKITKKIQTKYPLHLFLKKNIDCIYIIIVRANINKIINNHKPNPSRNTQTNNSHHKV